MHPSGSPLGQFLDVEISARTLGWCSAPWYTGLWDTSWLRSEKEGPGWNGYSCALLAGCHANCHPQDEALAYSNN
jgi:hypothetical protein